MRTNKRMNLTKVKTHIKTIVFKFNVFSQFKKKKKNMR